MAASEEGQPMLRRVHLMESISFGGREMRLPAPRGGAVVAPGQTTEASVTSFVRSLTRDDYAERAQAKQVRLARERAAAGKRKALTEARQKQQACRDVASTADFVAAITR
jgi:hypothetical protein